MKFLNIPREGVWILIHAIVGLVILISLFGCGTLTTLDSCKSLVGEQKTECIEKVEARQRRFENRREIFIGVRR